MDATSDAQSHADHIITSEQLIHDAVTKPNTTSPASSHAIDFTFKPQPQSRLLSGLPGELRNRIMRFVVQPETHVTVYRVRTEREMACFMNLPGKEILDTCKQLRSEFTDIVLLETTFHLDEAVLKGKGLETFAAIVKDVASEMRELRISHRVYMNEVTANGSCDKVNIRLTKDGFGNNCQGLPHTLFGGDEVLCMCKLQTLVPTKSTGSVVDWVLDYVRILRLHEQPGGDFEDYFHCWMCAGRVWKHGLSLLQSEEGEMG